MPRYLLLARDPGEWSRQTAALNADEVQAIIARYQAWAERVAGRGGLLSGEKLKDGEGRVLVAQHGSVRVADGPHTVSKEVIGGFWILKADTYDAAVELAKDSPHLEFGSLELREIQEL